MNGTRKPYARTLAVLRVLSWPYRYPPLSWAVAGIDWLSRTNLRLGATFAVSASLIVWAVATRG